MLKRSTKFWLLGSTVPLSLTLALPFLFGWHAQYVLNEINGLRIPIRGGQLGAIELAVSDIQRHWWHSSATINMNYHAPASENNPTSLKPIVTTVAHISHGPFLWRPNSDEQRPLWGQAWIEAPVNYVTENLPARFVQITGSNTGMIKGYISLLADQKIWAKTNEISFQDEQGQLNFSGFNFEMERSLSGKEMTSAIVVPHFNFLLYPINNQEGVRWVVDDVQLRFSGDLDHPAALWYGTWFGHAALTFDALQLEAQGIEYSANQFSYQSTHGAGNDSDEMNGETKIKIENFAFDKQTMGPFKADISYTHIDRAALEDIRKLYDDWFSSDSTLSFYAHLRPEQKDQLFNDLLQIVNRKPSYQINDFVLVTESGTLSGDAGVTILAPAKDRNELDSFDYWIKNVDAHLDLTASEALVKQTATWGLSQFYMWLTPFMRVVEPTPVAPAPITPDGPSQPVMTTPDYQAEADGMLNQAESIGFIKSEDHKYYMSVRYEHGVLSVSDIPVIDLSGDTKK